MQGVFLIESNKILVQGCKCAKFEIDWDRETIAFSGDFRIGKSEMEEILEEVQQEKTEEKKEVSECSIERENSEIILLEKITEKRRYIKKNKNLPEIKEKIIQFLKDKGGKGTFYYTSTPISRSDAIKEHEKVKKAISTNKKLIVVGIKELIQEGKLRREFQGQGGASFYILTEKEENIIPEIQEEIPEKIHTEEKKEILPKGFVIPPAKPLSTYEKLKLKKRCLRCNSQLEIQDLRSSGAREIALFSEEMREFLHCICCGQDYYPEESEVQKVA